MEEVIGSIPLGSTISLVDLRTVSRRLRAGCDVVRTGLLVIAALLLSRAAALSDPSLDGQTLSTPSTDALVADLRHRIVDADSATAVLEAWCAEKGLAGQARLIAHRQAVPDKPLTAEQRKRLGVSDDEPIRYRHVRLACGDRVLSEADNWYVPSRLTPAMNATLDGTDAPFGRVVRPLAPKRHLVAVRTFPLTAAPGPDEPLIGVDAVLVAGDGIPFCEVVETYLGAALPKETPR